MQTSTRRGVAAALGAAALFGASAPLIKLLLRHSGVFALSSLLYLGAALSLTLSVAVSRGRRAEAPLRRGDLPSIAAVALLGGMAGPWLLLLGLRHVSGMEGALLLNLEGPLTLLLAVALFGEHVSRRVLLAASLVFVGAVVLERDPGRSSVAVAGALAIAGACAAWALDNNVTQRLALRDPLRVVQAKAAAAAVAAASLAVVTGSRFPTGRYALGALLLGGSCYGSSIVLDVWALRLLGAARESALFATAPFIGAALAIPFLTEQLQPRVAVAAAVMAAGVVVLVREDHTHTHAHLPVEHDHAHAHDAHHRHAHDDQRPELVGRRHSHTHRHQPLRHAHPHVSDAHHRHEH